METFKYGGLIAAYVVFMIALLWRNAARSRAESRMKWIINNVAKLNITESQTWLYWADKNKSKVPEGLFHQAKDILTARIGLLKRIYKVEP